MATRLDTTEPLFELIDKSQMSISLCSFMLLCVVALITDVAVHYRFHQRHDDEGNDELIYALSSPAVSESNPITSALNLSWNECFQVGLQDDFGMMSLNDERPQNQFNQYDIVIHMFERVLIEIVHSIDSQHELNVALNHAVNTLKLEIARDMICIE